MKHITLALRRFAEAKAELSNLQKEFDLIREDGGAAKFASNLQWLKERIERNLLARLDDAIQSAEWAAAEPAGEGE